MTLIIILGLSHSEYLWILALTAEHVSATYPQGGGLSCGNLLFGTNWGL